MVTDKRLSLTSMDMLSKLPEPILCHILSFLPTKTSVACSVLSKRWKLLWTFVPVLDLDENRDMPKLLYDSNYEKQKERDKERVSRFQQIVDNVCFFPREFPVKKLRLCLRINDSRESKLRLQKWVSAYPFEELDLAAYYGVFMFPKSFHYDNLVVLKLNYCKLGSVESCLFPKLRVLHLLWVSFEDKSGCSFEDFLENFLSACPVLEELAFKKLRLCRPMMICVPTLTSLILQCEEESDLHFNYQFVLETPALEYLSFKYDAAQDCIMTSSLCNLRRADITCLVLTDYEDYGFFLMKLLENLSSVECLKLSFEKMGYWRDTDFDPFTWRGLVDKFDYSCLNELPVFDNLTRLELCIPSCDCVLVPYLLQKFHNLKYLSISKAFDIEEAEVCWKEPEQVPICLSSTLLSFCFQGFEDSRVEVVKYIKNHAKVLKDMTLQTFSSFKGLEGKVKSSRKFWF